MKALPKALLTFIALVGSLFPLSSAIAAPCTIQAGVDCEFSITVDGRSREYLLHVPDGYDGTPIALVVDVHGFAHTPENQRNLSGMYELSDIENFAVAYPRGGPAKGGGWLAKGFNGSDSYISPGCCGTPSSQNWDDVALLVAVKNDVAAKLNINKNYLTGLSNGSYMGHRVLCEAPEEFDAYATTSAALSESWENCNPAYVRPILYMHGRNDTTQPIGGSSDVAGEYMLSTADTMAIYASRNSCSGYPSSYVETFSSGTSWCREYTGCSVSVSYCELEAPHITYGATSLNVAEVFWDFFSRH
ncbi:alpha/beta hydrolase family esterase [Neptunicella sp.]|uniref:alpha/beta hydrolase family esterase n=1 Tax=Neptunicella sp. TaxID=2125986 RepID=UPI003F68C352